MTDPSERNFEGHALAVFENERIIFGYTTTGFTSAALQRFLGMKPLLFLKQVHGERIVSQADWRPAVEADGLILDRPGAAAVIQTADCLPLFFYDDDLSRGGVIHVGWRGLLAGIEEKLVALLGAGSGKYNFFLGPAIEKKCYEVGEEVPPLFRGKAYAERIFAPLAGGKHSLDIKIGLTLSLQAVGIAPGRIRDCGLCTFCSQGRFPSYRRDGKTGKRIFNFLMLKSGAPDLLFKNNN